jgi:hypothetical protein
MDGVKVFTATKARERDALGGKVTEWLRSSHPKTIKETFVTQSSDDEFHCLSITLRYSVEKIS